MSTALAAQQARTRAELSRTRRLRGLGLVLAALVLAATVLLSLGVGARDITPMTVWQALTAYDDAVDEHVMISALRVPRTVVALIVGPALGICGALIQAFTRNPLADPGILGVNAGATFGVTLAVGLLGIATPSAYIWFALLGAGAVTILVHLLGSAGGGPAAPARMTLAGVAISAVLSGLTTAIILSDRQAFDDLRFWGVGSVGGRDLGLIARFAPLIAIGLVLALLAARPLNALALGDDLASSMGVRVDRMRGTVVLAVSLLAGTATALAGPIGFVGLVVPHAVRWFTGPDQRWIMAYTVLVSPILLIAADIVGRIILPSGELRVGLVTAVIGAPVLIILARRKGAAGL